MGLSEHGNDQLKGQTQPLSHLPRKEREQRGGGVPLLQRRPTGIQLNPGQVHSPQFGEWGNGAPLHHLPEGIRT